VRSVQAIFSVKYTPAGPKTSRAVAGFLRYVQYRDHHELPERAAGVEGLVRDVAYRDAASPQGRLFDAQQTVGDRERKELNAYVRRSTAAARGLQGRPPRAVYRLVISPEDARGLDLRAMTRATMASLSREVSGLPPWVAAEHRNTAHPHVHVVMPAFREVAPGRYRQLVISKARLATMKESLARELERQRGVRPQDREGDRRARTGRSRSHREPQWQPRRRQHLSPVRGVPVHHVGGHRLGHHVALAPAPEEDRHHDLR